MRIKTILARLLVLPLILVVSSCSSQPAKSRSVFKGYFAYMADVALFTDCEDNQKYPVVQEGDYLKLETEYLQTVNDGGEKVFITFQGKIVEKDRVEGEGTRKFIYVKKLDGLFPGKSCD